MKKVVRLAVMAIAVVGLTAACKQAPAENTDTLPVIDTIAAIEEVADTTAEEVAVAEEPVKTCTKAKKEETKKEETNVEKLGNNASGKATAGKGSMTLTKADGTKTTSKNDLNTSDAQLKKANENTGKKGIAAVEKTKGRK